MRKVLVLVMAVTAAAMWFPACMTGGGDDGGTDTVQADTGPIELSHAGAAIDAGGSYNIPDNNDPASSNVALFSEQKDLMTLTNRSTADLTVNSITIIENEGTFDEEFSIVDAESLKNEPLTVADQVIPAGGTFDFYVRFYPVFSSERSALLSIDYTASDGAHTFELNVTGSGRPSDNAVPFSGAALSLHKVLGSIGTDEQVTGMVGDADGNTYFLAQTKVVPGFDGFYYDTVVGRINADGSKGWLKIYSRENAWEWSPDPGQNDETGGSPNAIVLADGFIYVAGAMSGGNQNNNNAAHVMKVGAADGALAWDKVWRPEWTDGSLLDRMNATGYAVDVAGGRVFVTGSSGDGNAAGTLPGNSSVFLLALSAEDGTLVFQQAVDVAVGFNDRGYAVASDSTGANVYVGGLTNGSGLLVKFGKTDTATPEVAWAKQLDMGTGSDVYGMDEDGGDVYLALDRRGAATFFSVARIKGADGTVAWAKTYEGNAGDNNNCNLVRVIGEHVYAGGRIGFSVMDAQMGDGFILRLGKADGALDWSGVYYTGKGPNEIEEHRVKGVAVAGTSLYLVGQVYTGSTGDSSYRYDGYWYDGLGSLADYPELTPGAIAQPALFATTNGEARNSAEVSPAKWEDLPDVLTFTDATEKKNGNGATVDEDLFWMKLELK